MIKFIQNLIKSSNQQCNINDVRRMLNFKRQTDERIAILEMLLWKYHTEGIPNDVCKRLIQNRFMKETSKGTFCWTELSDEIGREFNSKFNYA